MAANTVKLSTDARSESFPSSAPFQSPKTIVMVSFGLGPSGMRCAVVTENSLYQERYRLN